MSNTSHMRIPHAALTDTVVHGSSTGHDNVSVEVLSDVQVTLHDRVVGRLVDTRGLETQEGRLEEGLRTPESLVTDGDDLSVRQLVALLELRRLRGGLELLLKVEGAVAELLLDVTDDFSLGRGGEGVASLHEDLDEVLGEVSSGKVETENGVRERETLVNGHSVRDTVTRVEDDTGRSARSVQRQDGLDRHVEGRGVERLEHDLRHLLSVLLRVERGLGKKHGVLLRGDSELVVEGVVPDLLHVVPVGNNTVLNGVLQGKDTSLGLGLVSALLARAERSEAASLPNVRVLLTHTDHDTLVSGSTDDGTVISTYLECGSQDLREDSSGSIISGETGLAHTGTIVNDLDVSLSTVSGGRNLLARQPRPPF